MNKKQRNQKIKENYNKYHVPSMSNIHRIKRNVVFISTANDLKHELKKLEICYELKKIGAEFITEAERNHKKGEAIKRVDVVNLVTGDEYEIVYKHELDEEIEQYRKDGVIPIIINPMECTVCGKFFPKRTKKDICQICKKVK